MIYILAKSSDGDFIYDFVIADARMSDKQHRKFFKLTGREVAGTATMMAFEGHWQSELGYVWQFIPYHKMVFRPNINLVLLTPLAVQMFRLLPKEMIYCKLTQMVYGHNLVPPEFAEVIIQGLEEYHA